jgi:vacuolar-type H+-ATPase subunit E/Vma4
MSADGLKKAVLDRARAEAEGILAQAKKDAEGMAAAAGERAERVSKDVLDAAKRDAARTRAREVSALDRELRLKSLASKNALIDSVFVKAQEMFRQLPASDLGGMYAKELDAVDVAGATLLVARGASSQFASAQAKGATLREDDAVSAGYILVRDDFRLDRTLKARLDELRSTMRGELAKTLFQENA